MQPKALAVLALTLGGCAAGTPCIDSTCAADAGPSGLDAGIPRDAGPAGQAALALSRPALAFGQVPLDASRTLPVQLDNVGSAPTQALALSVSGGAFTFDAGQCPQTLGADAGCTLWVTFAPLAQQAYSGVLRVQEGDAGARTNFSG